MRDIKAKHRTSVQGTAVTVSVSLGGGLIAYALGMPAPWVAGGMLAVGAASLAGLRTSIAGPLRGPVYLVLGLYSGSGVTPDTLHQMRTWPGSFSVLAVSMVVMIATSFWWLHRRSGWDRDTALLASLPGALAFVIAAGEKLPVDLKKVTLSQSIRIIALVELVPLLALIVGHSEMPPPDYVRGATRPLDVLGLIAAGTVSAMVLERLRMPGGWLLGGLLASAALFLTGVVTTRPPDYLVLPGMIVMAAIAGSRFRPGDLAELPAIAGPALIAFLIAAGVTAASAGLVSLLFGINFIQALLAFAPGALEALVIIAYELNADPAYVAAHQVARFMSLVLLVPLLAAWLARHARRPDR